MLLNPTRIRAIRLPESHRRFLRATSACLLLAACIPAPAPAATSSCEPSATQACPADVKATPARRTHSQAHRPRRVASDPDLFSARSLTGNTTKGRSKKGKSASAQP